MQKPVSPHLTADSVVLDEGKILLIKRGHPPYQDSWALPGGFVEAGETVEQACLRELMEETGIQGRIMRLVGVYSDPGRDPRGHTVTVAYLVLKTGGVLKAGDDAGDACWHPIEGMPELAFDHGEIVEDSLSLL